MKLMTVPKIFKCNRILLLRSIHTGRAICIGFTKDNHPELPKGDVIHMCWLSKEGVEKQVKNEVCCPLNRISCTPDEAQKIGISFIQAKTLYENEVKKNE